MALSQQTTQRALSWLQISLVACTFVCGLVTSVSLGWIGRILHGGCPFDGSMHLSREENSVAVMLDVEVDFDTNGGNTCSYCLFANVAVIVYAVVWIWFYVFLCRQGCTKSRSVSDS